jgi:hypothetical protein
MLRVIYAQATGNGGMTTKRRGRPRKLASGPLHDRYRELEGRGWNASNIWRALSDEYPDLAPDQRTIQRYVAEDRSLDKSGPWRLWMSEPEDVPAVFESLRAAIRASEGETRWVSAAEAEWIVRFSRMGATAGWQPLDPFGRYLQARMLARAEALDDSDYTPDLLFAVTNRLLPDGPGMRAPGQSLDDWIRRGPRKA